MTESCFIGEKYFVLCSSLSVCYSFSTLLFHRGINRNDVAIKRTSWLKCDIFSIINTSRFHCACHYVHSFKPLFLTSSNFIIRRWAWLCRLVKNQAVIYSVSQNFVTLHLNLHTGTGNDEIFKTLNFVLLSIG